MESRSLRRRATALAGASVLAAGVVAAAPSAAFAAPPAPVNGPQGYHEVSKTSNIELLANIPRTSNLNNFQTDLAFTGDYAVAGNYDGFTVYDISEPAEPEVVTTVVCPGSQNDVSIYGDLLFLSTDSPRENDSCSSTGRVPAPTPTNPNATRAVNVNDPFAWEGIKIFDISDMESPQYLKSINTDCGSHTNTMVPSKDLESVYVYVSSYSPPANGTNNCVRPHDKISVIDVPLDAPETASVVAEPVLFTDGGNPGSNGSSATSGCHDLTSFGSRDVMAGACMGDGVLFDISDRENPTIIDSVRDTENFSFWHSATFNNTGTKVVFTDELFGGGGNACLAEHYPTKGADAIYDIEGDDELVFKSYYKINRLQTVTENCVAHNGSLIPVKGKDIMVQAWYQGGLSVIDFTDSANPTEIAYFERGPMEQTSTTNPNAVVLGGNWSSYWYNGHIYTSEILRGFDVHELTGEMFDDAKQVESETLNPQMQQLYVEAVSFDSLRDLIDDSELSNSARASIVNRLDQVEKHAAAGSESRAVAALDQLIARANNQIKGDADDIATRNAIVAAAQDFRDDIAAADYYEK